MTKKEGIQEPFEDLITVGSNAAWEEGKFAGALRLNGTDGRVEFGPIRIENDYSYSLWVKPESNATSTGSAEMNIITKVGVPTMNHFRLFKQEGNGSIAMAFYSDGNNTPTIYASEQNVLSDSNWTHLGVVHQTDTGLSRSMPTEKSLSISQVLKNPMTAGRWIFVSANFLPVMKACPLAV